MDVGGLRIQERPKPVFRLMSDRLLGKLPPRTLSCYLAGPKECVMETACWWLMACISPSE